MKNKMPWKYRIIIVILALPGMTIPFISVFTPYNLWVNPLISDSILFFLMCAAGVDIYRMYVASKLNKKGEMVR